MQSLNPKNDRFVSSRIREMTILSDRYGAINLAQGFPEFDPPKPLLDELNKITYSNIHQYTANWGISRLREAIAKKQSRALDRNIDPEKEVLVTVGSTEAMLSVECAVLAPGDRVAVFSPYYNSYAANAVIVGAEPVYIPLTLPDFRLDADRLEAEFRKGVKLLILCNPSNPCGRVFTREELETIAELADRYDVYVATDEVYEHIVYEPHRHISFASLPGMFERTLTCSSMSKTYSVTGWRLGYVTGPHELLEQVRKYHDFFTVCAPAPLQNAAVTALSFGDDYYQSLQKLYTGKKEKFLKGLDQAGIKHNDPEGTYFVLADISEFGFDDDVEFARYLVKNYKVAGVPGSCFFADGRNDFIRFHFAKNDDTIDEVIRRLGRLKADNDSRTGGHSHE